MDLGLSGRVAAVAAASSGLGYAAALELAREGARVSICSRDRGRLDEALASLRAELAKTGAAPAELHAVAADLSSSEGPRRFVGETTERFGAPDILVASSGGPPPGRPLELADAAWEDGFALTFQSARRLAEAAIPAMRARRWGRIIFVTSISVKQPIEGLVISTALRSAVTGYAKALSDELAADGITVNCVAPGSTRTARLESLLESRARRQGLPLAEIEKALVEEIPARRFGTPAEFAAAVAFLASARASYISGTVLPIDGGLVRSLT
jgi:3-oxoacyl-[acyl-carrier protein] reductase